MNLFFYTRKVAIPETPEHPAGEVIYTDCFNLNKVVRSMQVEHDKVILVLDDIHERAEQVPDVKNGKVVGSKRERNTFQTEITLTGEDVTRFHNLANK